MASPNADGTSRPGTAALREKGQEALSHPSVQSKQRSAIEKIRRDNEDLKEELLIENKFSVRPTNQAAATRISELQNESDTLTRKIELEKRRIGFLETKVAEIRENIVCLRRKMGGTTATRDADRSLQKQIRILENRLEKAYRKFSEGTTKNRELRELIDNFRRERLMLDNINIGLERENDKLKREMVKVVKHSKTVHDSYDASLREAALLKNKTERIQAGYEKEWAELTEIIEQDRQAQEEKRAKDMEKREKKTLELVKYSESEVQRKIGRSATRHLDKQVQARSEALEKVQRYSLAFDQISEATGIEDMNEVVDQIAELEDCNYTLFNFVNEISRDIEFFQNQIEAIEGDLSTASPRAVKATDRGLADGIDSKQERDLAGEKPIDRSVDGVRKADLSRAIVGVSALLDLLPSDLKPDQIEVDRNNIVSALALIESYVQSACQTSESEKNAPIFMIPVKYSVCPPSAHCEDADGASVEVVDNEKPIFGAALKEIATKEMQLRSRASTVDLKSTQRSFRRKF